MKFCKDCRFCVPSPYVRADPPKPRSLFFGFGMSGMPIYMPAPHPYENAKHCTHPYNDPVDGNAMVPCELVRGAKDSCGPDAKWFDQKAAPDYNNIGPTHASVRRAR